MGRLLLLVWAAYSRVAMVNIKERMSIKITPNPSTDFIMISMDANLNPVTIRIFDPGGRLVFNKEQIANSPLKIPLHRFVKGWYVWRFTRKMKSIFKNFSNNRVFHTHGRPFQGGL